MKIYLTSLDSDVSGYKLALIDERNPAATTTVATTVTTLATGSHSLTAGGTGTKTAMTLTAGGSAAKWITKPFSKAFTIPAVRHTVCAWGKKGSSSARHAAIGFDLARMSAAGSVQTAFLVPPSYTRGASSGARVSAIEGQNHAFIGTTIANRTYATGAPNATAVSVGDRLVITGYGVNAAIATGSLYAQASTTLTMDYDGSTDGVDGDTWIEIPTGAVKALTTGAQTTYRQQTSHTTASVPGEGQGFYQNLIDAIDAAVATGKFTYDSNLLSFRNDLAAERDLN